MRLILSVLLISLFVYGQEEKEGPVLKVGAELKFNFSFLPASVAEYKGVPFSKDELLRLMSFKLAKMEGALLNQRELKVLVVKFLQESFRRKASLVLAERDGYEPNVGLASLQLLKMEKAQGKEAVQASFAFTGLPYSAAAQFLAETKALDEWFEDKIAPANQVGEAAALLYYSENKKKFEQPLKIMIAQIYTGFFNEKGKLAAQKKISLASGLLQEGESFFDVAKKVSEGKAAVNGGLLAQRFSRKGLRQELHRAFEMKKDQVSGVIESSDGFHIIKVINIYPEGTPEFKEINKVLIQKLSREYAYKAMENQVIEEMKASGFKIFVE